MDYLKALPSSSLTFIIVQKFNLSLHAQEELAHQIIRWGSKCILSFELYILLNT